MNHRLMRPMQSGPPPLRITSNDGGASANINVAEKQTAITTVAATGGVPPYEFSVPNVPSGGDNEDVSIDVNTGVLVFISPPNFESPIDEDFDNVYTPITVIVTDALLSTAQQTLTVTVTNVADNPVPTVVVTTQGVDGVSGAAEIFTVTGGIDETVTFSDGLTSGFVTFDADGLVSDHDIGGPSGYIFGGNGTSTATYTSTANGAKPDMAKTSGGGGTVAVTQQGVDDIPAVAEVVAINFDGSTGGTIKISGSVSIAWNADAPTVEAAIEAVAYPCAVTGSAGSFTLTADSAGTQADLTITENLLTK